MQQPPWQTGNINCATVDAAAKQPESLPGYESSHSDSANKGLNGYLFSGSFLRLWTPPPPPLNQHEETTTQKKFFIFDRSGAETRMILSSLTPPIANPTAKPEQACPEEHGSYESHEDHVIGEGSDYHEDTEEINALLYSDNDDIKDEDELSTGRSPLDPESDEEVTSFAHPPKRQKGSLPAQVHEDESVVDVDTFAEEPFPTVGSKRARDKIRGKLRLLEQLIPGSQSKDPLSILDEAIDYLKSLKVKAHSLHVEGETPMKASMLLGLKRSHKADGGGGMGEHAH